MSSQRWAAEAAYRFTCALPAPAVAGAGSTRAYRDIKGWIAALVHSVHALRWATLAAAVDNATRNGQNPEHAVNAITRAVIERVVVRQPSESRRIVTSNARRQCARLNGRLSLVRLVDLALALAALRRAAVSAGSDDYSLAHAFWKLVECLRGLRAVHDMDSTARSIDLCLFDPNWAVEHASDDAFSLDMPTTSSALRSGRADRTARIIRLAVFRASRVECVVDTAPPRSLSGERGSILMAAFVADFDPQRALDMADHCVELRQDVVRRIRSGAGPLPLKDLRMILFCANVMRLVSNVNDVAFIMQKLAQLFVPVGWHTGGAESGDGQAKLRQWTSEGNFSAEAVLGRRLAERGYREGQSYLFSALKKGDVAAPIVLGDLFRDGTGGFRKDARVARDHYNIAISRGSALAALNLGNMYLSGAFPEHASDAGKEAAKWFQVSVDRGNARAALSLGRLLYSGGPGEERDIDRSERCFAIAADRTTLPVVRMEASIGLAKVAAEQGDIAKAEGLFNLVLKSATRIDATGPNEQHAELVSVTLEALFAMAHMYRDASARANTITTGHQHESTQTLRDRACDCFRRIAELSSNRANPSPATAAQAWYGLGLLRLETQDQEGAIEGFRNATNCGHVHAAHNLGNLLLQRGETEQALRAFEIGAERGDKCAANNAGLLYAKQLNNYASAVFYFERAIELQSSAAPANLAQLYAKGAGNVIPCDVGKAKELAELAVVRGNREGVVDLLESLDDRPSPNAVVPRSDGPSTGSAKPEKKNGASSQPSANAITTGTSGTRNGACGAAPKRGSSKRKLAPGPGKASKHPDAGGPADRKRPAHSPAVATAEESGKGKGKHRVKECASPVSVGAVAPSAQLPAVISARGDLALLSSRRNDCGSEEKVVDTQDMHGGQATAAQGFGTGALTRSCEPYSLMADGKEGRNVAAIKRALELTSAIDTVVPKRPRRSGDGPCAVYTALSQLPNVLVSHPWGSFDVWGWCMLTTRVENAPLWRTVGETFSADGGQRNRCCVRHGLNFPLCIHRVGKLVSTCSIGESFAIGGKPRRHALALRITRALLGLAAMCAKLAKFSNSASGGTRIPSKFFSLLQAKPTDRLVFYHLMHIFSLGSKTSKWRALADATAACRDLQALIQVDNRTLGEDRDEEKEDDVMSSAAEIWSAARIPKRQHLAVPY